MHNRKYSYDYLRAISAIMIIICHIFYGFGLSRSIGNYLSGVFVYVFILLSGLLLGFKYENNDKIDYVDFLLKRFGKLIPTYYTFLAISLSTVTVLAVVGGGNHLTCRQIISHACALNWIIPKGSITEPPFPQLGHLWFMTCILFCYLYVFILGVSGIAKNIFYNNVKLLAYFVSFSIIWTLQVFYIGKFEQLGISILSFSILFFRGKTIIEYFDKIRLSKLIIIFVVINFSAIYWYFNGLSDFPTLRIWVNLFCALSWIVIFPRLAYSKAVPIALYISQISYELYLVHHPFTMGEYSLLKYFPMKFAIVGVLILSLCLASLLHYAVSFGQNRIKRVISAE